MASRIFSGCSFTGRCFGGILFNSAFFALSFGADITFINAEGRRSGKMDYIASYGKFLESEKHASPNTVSSYLRDVSQFQAYLKDNQNTEVQRKNRKCCKVI